MLFYWRAALFSGVAPNAIMSLEGPIAPKLQPGKAILVMELNVVGRGDDSDSFKGAYGAWIKVDPSSGLRDTSADLEFDFDDATLPSDAPDGTRYYFFSVPPGTYALGWVASRGKFFLSSAYKRVEIIQSRLKTDYYFSSLAMAKADAPSFTIGAGDVVYIGDLVGDFSRMAQARLSIKSDEVSWKKAV